MFCQYVTNGNEVKMIMFFFLFQGLRMGKRKAHQMSDGDSDEDERSPVVEAPKRKKSKTKLNANESKALISPESLLETDHEVWIVKVPKHVSFRHQ